MDSNTTPPIVPTRKATRRLDLRARQRLQWALVGIISVMMMFALYPYVVNLRETRWSVTCQTNVKKIAGGLSIYASDYDGALPLADSWVYTAQSGMTSTSNTGFKIEQYFKCPKDETGKQASYAFNELLSGLSLNVRSSDSEKEARRSKLNKPNSVPLVFEKHGSDWNAHEMLADWDAFRTAMTLPHNVGGRSGWYIRGDLNPASMSDEKIEGLKGKTF